MPKFSFIIIIKHYGRQQYLKALKGSLMHSGAPHIQEVMSLKHENINQS